MLFCGEMALCSLAKARRVISLLVPLVLPTAVVFLSFSLTFAQTPVHGRVEGHTYIDARFGLRYTFPSPLESQTSLNGMPVGTGEKQGISEFLLDAMEKPNGQVRSGVFITADPAGALGAKDSKQFLALMLVTAMGFRGDARIQPVEISGRTFYRSSVGGGTQGVHFYGAQLMTSCNGRYLGFWFSASSPKKVEDLVHSMDQMELKCSSIAQ